MKKQIQIKRNKPTKSNYRVLYAKTGRRRKLHAATTAASSRHAGLGADVPNIGVGKALFVILVLHVLAVAAIYIHSVYEKPSANKGQASSPVDKAAVFTPAEAKSQKPMVKKKKPAALPLQEPASMGRYIVITGDTYPLIAKNRNVSVKALRALNNDRPLRPGVVLDLPAQLSARPVDPAPAVVVKKAEPEAPVQKPSAPKVVVAKQKESAQIEEVVVAKPAEAVKPKPQNDVSKAPKAILVADEIEQPAAAVSGVRDSGQTYKIQRGDTLWGIASRFKVGRDDLLALNRIKDANKLYAGRTIKIPAQ